MANLSTGFINGQANKWENFPSGQVQVQTVFRVFNPFAFLSPQPNTPTDPTDRVHILEDRSLRLEGVTLNDEGEYICEADNAVGSITATGTLTVHCEYTWTTSGSGTTLDKRRNLIHPQSSSPLQLPRPSPSSPPPRLWRCPRTSPSNANPRATHHRRSSGQSVAIAP